MNIDLSERLVVSPQEAAVALGLSRARVYQLLNDGTLPSIYIGRARRIRVEHLTGLLDRLEGEQNPDE